MTSPDLTAEWTRQRLSRFAVRNGTVLATEGHGSLKDGEEAYTVIFDSRDDHRFRTPIEWKTYYLSKRLPVQETTEQGVRNIAIAPVRAYHEHYGRECPLGLDKASAAGVQPKSPVAPADGLKPVRRRRHRGSRGKR